MFLFLAIGTRMMARATVAGKNVISYIYTRERYSWDGVHFSNYKTATLVVKVVGKFNCKLALWPETPHIII